MLLRLLYLFTFLSLGCVTDQGSIDISGRGAGAASTTALATVTSVTMTDGDLIINGTNLSGVNTITLTDNGSFNASFNKKAGSTNTQIIADATMAITIAAGTLLDLIITDAQGASTFPVDFNLPQMGALDGEVLAWSTANNQWEPKNLNGVNLVGTWNSTTNQTQAALTLADNGANTLPATGDFYIVTVGCAACGTTIDGITTWSAGDWMFFDGTDWTRVQNAGGVTDVFGMYGSISFGIDTLTDVDTTTSAPSVGEVLQWDGANWVPAANSVTTVSTTGSSTIAADSGNTGTGDIVFETGTTPKMTLTNSGSLGIGTSTPSNLLDVEGATNPGLVVEDTTNNVTATVQSTDTDVNIGSTSNHRVDLISNNTTNMSLLTDGTVAMENYVLLREQGSSPSNTANYGKLYVKTDNNLYYMDEAGTETNLLAASGGVDNDQAGDLTLNADNDGSGAGDDILFNINGTTEAVILNNGNMGIGTTSPNRLLEVAGPVRVSPAALPGTPAAGDLAIDSGDSNKLKFYDGSAWVDTGASGSGATNIDGLSDGANDGSSVFLGTNSGTVDDGANSNVGLGFDALTANVSGDFNVAVGWRALPNNTATSNTAIGGRTLHNNTSGSHNTAVGREALFNGSAGSNNTAVGSLALTSNSGSDNTAIGVNSLLSNSSGARNTASGHQAGRYIADGSTANTTSNDSVYLGASTKANADSQTNQIVIGYDAIGIGSNSVVLGNDSIATTALKGNVGIGTTSPDATLDVDGTIISKPATDNTSGTTIDFATGNLQYTDDDCQTYALHNMKDGGTYSFVVKGGTPATCIFNAFSDAGTTALTVHLPPSHAATTNATHTMYSLMVMGTDVYIAWVPGL